MFHGFPKILMFTLRSDQQPEFYGFPGQIPKASRDTSLIKNVALSFFLAHLLFIVVSACPQERDTKFICLLE